jgi:CRP-like cAMP-binding protein
MPADDRHLNNRLLAALSSDELERLRPLLTTTQPLAHGLVMEVRHRAATHVYFPWSGVCSLTTVMLDGALVEVGTIGNEGLVGMSVYFGGQPTDLETVVQVEGAGASVMRAGTFVAEMERRGPLYQLVRRYSQALLALMTRSVACNALHDVDARCARWLLMTHDRVTGDAFSLTHEYLASMLGVRRPTVTLVLRKLQQKGLIRAARGRITVARRRGLEALSCECYGVVRTHFDRLVP